MKAADIARAAFDKLITLTVARLYDSFKGMGAAPLVQAAIDDVVSQLRADFDKAIIELRFDVMEVQAAALDLQKLVGEREAREAYERGKATGEGLDVTRISPETGQPVAVCYCGHDETQHLALNTPGATSRKCFADGCTCGSFENVEDER